MNTEIRLKVLREIYTIYEDVVAKYDTACQLNCSACCTADVTATSVEALLILQKVPAMGVDVSALLKNATATARFQPVFSINRLAEICGRGQKPPVEPAPAGNCVCPFLDRQHCRIYAVRPFGCRSMVSRRDCRQYGYATMDDVWIAVNDLFMQYIEHIDAHGITGNLIDVLLLLGAPTRRKAYEENLFKAAGCALAANQRIHFLAAAPEYAATIRPLLERLNRINIAAGN